MYEKLVQELRHGELARSTGISRRKLMENAANAIEILSRHDAEVDDIARQICEIRDSLGCNTMDEFMELVRDGRVLAMPCKIHDQVWAIVTVKGRSFVNYGRAQKIRYSAPENRWMIKIDHWKEKVFSETIFLSREEAEAALKERSQ